MPATTDSGGPNAGLLARAHFFVLVVGVLYASLVVLLTIPFFQTQFREQEAEYRERLLTLISV